MDFEKEAREIAGKLFPLARDLYIGIEAQKTISKALRKIHNAAYVSGQEDMRETKFEIRKPDGAIDEVVANCALNFHLEQMDDTSWYLGFDTPDGTQHQFWVGAKNGNAHVECRHTDSYTRAEQAPLQSNEKGAG